MRSRSRRIRRVRFTRENSRETAVESPYSRNPTKDRRERTQTRANRHSPPRASISIASYSRIRLDRVCDLFATYRPKHTHAEAADVRIVPDRASPPDYLASAFIIRAPNRGEHAKCSFGRVRKSGRATHNSPNGDHCLFIVPRRPPPHAP